MKKLIVLLLSVFCATGLSAQDRNYFPTVKGAELGYKYYNGRGKALKDQWKTERWMKFVVEDVWPTETGMVINVGIGNELIERMAASQALGTAAASLAYGDVKMDGDMVTLDNVQWVADVLPEMFTYLLAYEQRGGEEGSKFDVELLAQTAFPRNMTVGQELPDENVLDAEYKEVLTPEQQAEREEHMREMKEHIEMMNMTYGTVGVASVNMNIGSSFSFTLSGKTRNRKVEAFEKVETPAGTFECYKITYELVMSENDSFRSRVRMDGYVMQSQQEPESVRHADWLSPEVGLVKRERYNARGKVQEMMQLETYKK